MKSKFNFNSISYSNSYKNSMRIEIEQPTFFKGQNCNNPMFLSQLQKFSDKGNCLSYVGQL